MANFVQGKSLRTLQLGTQVVKSAAVVPNAAAANLFTVTGGAVLVTSLVGKVTTVFTSTATTLSMGPKPTTGSANATGIHSATVLTSAALGSWIAPALSSGVATTGIVAAGIAWPQNGSAFVCDAGFITYQASAANTGQIQWYLSYIPLDDGAAVS